MSFLLEARHVGEQRTRNKIMTLLVMGCFALSFTFLGYTFDYLMGTFNNLQLITIPVAVVLIISTGFNLIDGLNERFSDQSPEDDSQDYSIKAAIWMISTTLIIMVWMVFYELAYIDPHTFGKPKALIVLGETSPYGVMVGALLGVGAAFSTLQWGAYSILRSVEAAPADGSFEGDHPVLSAVEEVSKAAGIPAPAVFIVQDDAPNAFAIGRSPRHASIVVSQGLLDTLSPEEIKGVVAHEISHIRSYDIRLRTAVTALFGSVVLLSHWAIHATSKGGKAALALPKIRSVKKILLLVFWLLSLFVVPLVTFAVVVLTFRHREYLADASAAELTHDPDALAHALTKIEQAVGTSTMLRSNTAHLCIIDPMNRAFNSKEGWFADMLATHPPTTKRILALESMVSWYKPTVAHS
jgi:heat shock protein HtpX